MMQQRSAFDRRELAGPFDIVGDVHGCCDELEALLALMGYAVVWSGQGDARAVTVTPPAGRTLVFVGDLVDRGPRVADTLRIAMAMTQAGTALCVDSNHDNKFGRWMSGSNVQAGHGLQQTIDAVETAGPAFRERVRGFIAGLPIYLWLDGGALVVAHAGLKQDMIGREDGKVRQFALYGDTTGKVDEDGYPERRNWAASYSGEAAIVYGHVAAPDVQVLNNTICLDTGCCYGGRLTAVRWPERELVSVAAAKVHYVPKRALADRTR